MFEYTGKNAAPRLIQLEASGCNGLLKTRGLAIEAGFNLNRRADRIHLEFRESTL